MIKISEELMQSLSLSDLLEQEEIEIKALTAFQEKLNNTVVNYIKQDMQVSFLNCTSPDYDKLSSTLIDNSKILKRLVTTQELCKTFLQNLTKLKKDLTPKISSSFTLLKPKVDDYNKKISELNKKLSNENIAIQSFISEYEKNQIIEELIKNKKAEQNLGVIELPEKSLTTNAQKAETAITPIESKENSIININNTEVEESSILQPKQEIIEEKTKKTVKTKIAKTHKGLNVKSFRGTIKPISTAESSNTIDIDGLEKMLEEIDNYNTEIKNPADITIENIDSKPQENFQKNIIKSDINTKDDNINPKNNSQEEESLFELNSTNEDSIGDELFKQLENQNSNSSDSQKVSTPMPPKGENTINNTVISQSSSNEIVENTLIISEKNNNVVFPYTISELQTKLSSNPDKYTSLNDVVAKDYTKPLSYYKNSAKARFKEAYNLVRNKSHGSKMHALDLATEAFFKSNLHPAIISACKNTDELDIYLSCLEFDELEDFKIFNIVFDIMPTISKKLKKQKANA